MCKTEILKYPCVFVTLLYVFRRTGQNPHKMNLNDRKRNLRNSDLKKFKCHTREDFYYQQNVDYTFSFKWIDILLHSVETINSHQNRLGHILQWIKIYININMSLYWILIIYCIYYILYISLFIYKAHLKTTQGWPIYWCLISFWSLFEVNVLWN